MHFKSNLWEASSLSFSFELPQTIKRLWSFITYAIWTLITKYDQKQIYTGSSECMGMLGYRVSNLELVLFLAKVERTPRKWFNSLVYYLPLIIFYFWFSEFKISSKIGQNTILLTFQRWLHINIVFIKQIAVKVSKYKCSIILRRENSTTVKVWLLRSMIWWDMWTSNIPVSELAKRRRSGQLYVHMHYVYYFKARIKKKKKKRVTGFFLLSLTTLLFLPVLLIGLEKR